MPPSQKPPAGRPPVRKPAGAKPSAEETPAKTASPPTSKALQGLLGILDLEALEENLYRGHSLRPSWSRVYGGQVLAQALVAGTRTVSPERSVHSLHAYFLRGGDPGRPILYDVERLRDGKSFSTRRISAIQAGTPIFFMTASFHRAEPGFSHQMTMPNVAPPETLLSASALMASQLPDLPAPLRAAWGGEQPIELRPVDPTRYLGKGERAPEQQLWMRANGRLPDDSAIHACVLAYASDFTLLDTALVAHGRVVFDPELSLASLDHALWFHRPFRADDWLLYAQDSPSAESGRGFCRGSVFSRDGLLVASVAQEGVVRRRADRGA